MLSLPSEESAYIYIWGVVSEARCGRNKRTEGQKRERGCI